MRRVLCAIVVLVGCDGNPALEDAGCGMPGVAEDQPVIDCPAEVDLGCIALSGASLNVDPAVAACDGSEPRVGCTPASVTPGTVTGMCTAMSPSGARAECFFAIRYRVEGPPQIVCSDVTAACTGPLTTVEPTPANVMESCDGGAVGVPTSDGASTAFAVGSTPITWMVDVAGGSRLACTQNIVVTDGNAPVLDCSDQTLVRTAPSAAPTFIPPSATDDCDDDVTVVVPDVPSMRGDYTLGVTATDDAGNESTCVWNVEILDVFAAEGLRVLSAELATDGSTDVTIGWDGSTGTDVTALRLDRATTESGPWTELATFARAGETQTYTDAAAPAPVVYYRLVSLADATEGGIAGPIRAFGLADDEYNLRDQSVPGIGFATSLFGVVRRPMDLSAGPFPLVLFMHGNHGNCRPLSLDEDDCDTRQAHECTQAGFTTTPNAHGYVYLQETLASQGYVTVSVSANALNCRMDFIPERTQLILEHLRRWVQWSGSSGGAPFGTTFAGAVDMERVALVGHSRGGEAVARAPGLLRTTPIAGVSLASVFGIGPTDYHDNTPSGVPFAVLLPACDADVRTLEGLRQYDRGLDPSDANERAQVLLIGANHNFFNTEWRFDDNERLVRVCTTGQQVGGPAQRGMLEVVLADWIVSTTTTTRAPAYLRAESDTPAIIEFWADHDLDLRWSYAAASRLVIDDFVGSGSPNVNDRGGTNSYTGFIAGLSCTGSCARNFPHLVGSVRPAWRDVMASASFDVGDLDATPWNTLSMRFASRIATINDGLTEHELGIRVTDISGTVAEVPLTRVGRLAHRYTSNFEQEILSTVRVPMSAFTEVASMIDLAHLRRIEVVMPIPGGNLEGSIWMTDLDLASD